MSRQRHAHITTSPLRAAGELMFPRQTCRSRDERFRRCFRFIIPPPQSDYAADSRFRRSTIDRADFPRCRDTRRQAFFACPPAMRHAALPAHSAFAACRWRAFFSIFRSDSIDADDIIFAAAALCFAVCQITYDIFRYAAFDDSSVCFSIIFRRLTDDFSPLFSSAMMPAMMPEQMLMSLPCRAAAADAPICDAPPPSLPTLISAYARHAADADMLTSSSRYISLRDESSAFAAAQLRRHTAFFDIRLAAFLSPPYLIPPPFFHYSLAATFLLLRHAIRRR